MLSADISDVLKSILLHVASLSRLFSCPFKLERRPDQIMSVYFYAKANAAYDIAPFVFKGRDFGDGWFGIDTQYSRRPEIFARRTTGGGERLPPPLSREEEEREMVWLDDALTVSYYN